MTPLPVLWAISIASVAARRSTDETVRAAANAAAIAAKGLAAKDTAAAPWAITAAGDSAAAAVGGNATAYATAYAAEAAATFTAAAAWNAVRGDAAAVEAGRALSERPLWPEDNPFQSEWDAVKANWSHPDSPYTFWLRWYESLLDPENNPPINPELLRKIVLIEEEKWRGEDAPEVIAAEIELLEEQFDLLAITKEVRKDHAAIVAGYASRAHRSDNLPKGEDPLDVEIADASQIDEPLRQAEAELLKSNPSRAVLVSVGKALLKASLETAKYAGRKADLALDTAIKWGIPAGGAYFLVKVQTLAKMIFEFAEKLPF